jgi:hypothetical protein
MRLLSRLEYEPSFGASWVTYFVRIPYPDWFGVTVNDNVHGKSPHKFRLILP